MALVLTGNLSLGTDVTPGDSDASVDAGLVDMSAEVIEFKIAGSVNTVSVPATMTTPIHGRGGANDFSVTISYLSNDITASPTLFMMLWAALATTTKSLYFEGSMRNPSQVPIGVANPAWAGYFIVTATDIGAASQTLSQGSATFPMTGPPTQVTVAP